MVLLLFPLLICNMLRIVISPALAAISTADIKCLLIPQPQALPPDKITFLSLASFLLQPCYYLYVWKYYLIGFCFTFHFLCELSVISLPLIYVIYQTLVICIFHIVLHTLFDHVQSAVHNFLIILHHENVARMHFKKLPIFRYKIFGLALPTHLGAIIEANYPADPHVFRMLETSGPNENMQTPHKQHPRSGSNRALWGSNSINCTIVRPILSFGLKTFYYFWCCLSPPILFAFSFHFNTTLL